jgi:hypothetical protein
VDRRRQQYIQSVSGKATMTLRLDAKLTPNARADSLWRR